MTYISASDRLVTVINVFTVAPDNQERLVELLTRATEDSVRHARGFVSASLHQSTDGGKVTMYAQWSSMDDYEAMRSEPTASPYLEEAFSLATFDPGMYKVVRTFEPVSKRT